VVIPFEPTKAPKPERGMLTTELVVAMSILLLAMFPMAYSFVREQQLCRSLYYRAVAMEIVDGEMESLVAGEWRAFKEGPQSYTVRADAAKNLPPGGFLLTLAEKRLRLEWLPKKSRSGGKVVREAELK
jgi:hypothetical protein